MSSITRINFVIFIVWFQKISLPPFPPPPPTEDQRKFLGEWGVLRQKFPRGVEVHRKLLFLGRRSIEKAMQDRSEARCYAYLSCVVKKAILYLNELNLTSFIASVFHLSCLLALHSLGLLIRYFIRPSQIKMADMTEETRHQPPGIQVF